MSKITVRRCDRCGERSELEEASAAQAGWAALFVLGLSLRIGRLSAQRSVDSFDIEPGDLCPQCAASFKTWLVEGD